MVECPCGISYDDGQAMIECERCKVCIAAYSSCILTLKACRPVDLDLMPGCMQQTGLVPSVVAELDIRLAVAGVGSHLLPQRPDGAASKAVSVQHGAFHVQSVPARAARPCCACGLALRAGIAAKWTGLPGP